MRLLDVDQKIIGLINANPGASPERIARGLLTAYSSTHVRQRIHVLAAHGLIRADVTPTNRYHLYPKDDRAAGGIGT